MTEKNRPFS